jgi:hypothetical protein
MLLLLLLLLGLAGYGLERRVVAKEPKPSIPVSLEESIGECFLFF